MYCWRVQWRRCGRCSRFRRDRWQRRIRCALRGGATLAHRIIIGGGAGGGHYFGGGAPGATRAIRPASTVAAARSAPPGTQTVGGTYNRRTFTRPQGRLARPRRQRRPGRARRRPWRRWRRQRSLRRRRRLLRLRRVLGRCRRLIGLHGRHYADLSRNPRHMGQARSGHRDPHLLGATMASRRGRAGSDRRSLRNPRGGARRVSSASYQTILQGMGTLWAVTTHR